MIICIILSALIVLLCLYGVYQVDMERYRIEQRKAQERAAAAQACYARQMARFRRHNMRGQYRRRTTQ